ncbi:MAG: peptidoglycan-binding domain-containing protein, partial [Candidatus Gracilibacteria bacterium]
TPTGNFGPITKEALGKFQIARGIVRQQSDKGYGYFGPRTKEALLNASSSAKTPLVASATVAGRLSASTRHDVSAVARSPGGEVGRLVAPPPEWIEKNPAAYKLYQKIAEEVAGGNVFPRSKKSQSPRSSISHGDNEERWKHDYLRVYPAYDELEHKCKPEKCDAKAGAYWKIDLNVEPKDVITVSMYLRNKGYKHSYLQGAPEEAFSVYIGSKDLTDKEVRILEKDLAQYLRKPRYVDSKYGLAQELGTNISGGFRVHKSAQALRKHKEVDIPGYGFAGIPKVGPYEKRNCNLNFFKEPESNQKVLALRDIRAGFLELTKLFGTYFHGTNK